MILCMERTEEKTKGGFEGGEGVEFLSSVVVVWFMSGIKKNCFSKAGVEGRVCLFLILSCAAFSVFLAAE